MTDPDKTQKIPRIKRLLSPAEIEERERETIRFFETQAEIARSRLAKTAA